MAEKSKEAYSSNVGLPDEAETCSLQSGASDTSLRSRRSLREHLQEFLRSTRCQVLLVGLVGLDTLLVVTELLLDLALKDKESPLPLLCHALSLFIMAIFVLEIILKIYAYGLDFFSHKGEVFDAVVVCVCVGLDAKYLHSHDAHAGTGFVVLLRLWRVIHIQRTIVSQMQGSEVKKLEEEREKRYKAEQELDRYRTTWQEVNAYVLTLERLLFNNKITFERKVWRNPDETSVEVEGGEELMNIQASVQIIA